MSAPVREGEVLAGKYRIDRVLGAGGMGVVVAATHLTLGDRVALKFLLPAIALDGEAAVRFQREARAAARIKSEHVARVFDVGTLENGSPYYVMEYLEGADLAELLQAGALPMVVAVDYILQACAAVAHAHALGIVHRDLKPANLFRVQALDGSELIKVLDFGISKLQDPSATDAIALTSTSVAMGSPLYMSPEQMTSARGVDARTDIWALGAVLFELLTGRTAFVGTTLPEVCGAILGHPTPSVRARRTEVPPELDAVIARCLEKSREARFSSVPELARALRPFASETGRLQADRVANIGALRPSAPLLNAPASLPVSSSEAFAPTAAVGGTNQPWARTETRPSAVQRRARWPLAVAVGAVSLVGVTLTIALATRSHELPPSPVVAARPRVVETATASSVTSLPAPVSVTASTPPAPTPVPKRPTARAPVTKGPGYDPRDHL